MPNFKDHSRSNPDAIGENMKRNLHAQRMARQAAPDVPADQPSCIRCQYVNRMVNPNNVAEPIWQCNRFPPTATVIPAQRGVAQLTGFPHVNASMWCHEFKAQPTADAGIAPPEDNA